MSKSDHDKYLEILKSYTTQLREEVTTVSAESDQEQEEPPSEDQYFKKAVDELMVEEEIADRKINRGLKVALAKLTFGFMVCVNIVCFYFLYHIIIIGDAKVAEITATVLSSAIPASMVLFGWVIRGVFK